MLRLGMAIFITAGVVATPVVAASPAQAAVSCSKTGCDGKDPEKTNCAGGATTVRTAFVLSSKKDRMVKVELRWSPTCKTNWGRVTAVGANKRKMRAAVGKQTSKGYVYKTGGVATAHSLYSPMWYAPKVCTVGWGAVVFSDGKSAEKYTSAACG